MKTNVLITTIVLFENTPNNNVMPLIIIPKTNVAYKTLIGRFLSLGHLKNSL